MIGNTPNTNTNVMWLKSGPVNVYTDKKRYIDNQTGEESVVRCISYLVGQRYLAFTITETCKADSVILVCIDVKEEYGRGSSAILKLWFTANDRYGVLSSMHTHLSGSFELVKHNYRVPPLPDTELACYFCPETGDGSIFTLEKKKGEGNGDVVEMVKGLHAFMVGDESVAIKLKIRNDRRVGLRVEIENPMKLTMEYTNRVFLKMGQRMENEMDNNVISLYKNTMSQLQGSYHYPYPYPYPHNHH
ncbi:hypothetical protein VNO80_20394 [Phaseolus coccineus]|uniref:Uncharacterized protein n=1 Tax=Phaseolus coccineus TaxID=3886 RepID=A0AAN9MMI6_PHACN